MFYCCAHSTHRKRRAVLYPNRRRVIDNLPAIFVTSMPSESPERDESDRVQAENTYAVHRFGCSKDKTSPQFCGTVGCSLVRFVLIFLRYKLEAAWEMIRQKFMTTV